MKKTIFVIGGVGLLGVYLNIPFKQPTPEGNPYKLYTKVTDIDNPNSHILTKIPVKIGIIGGGISGTILAKTLSEQGYNIEILDKNPSFGGLWYKNYDGSGLQFPYPHYNLPDFWFSESTELIPRASEVVNFVRSYAENFKITHLFRFNTEVRSIKQNEDETWTVFTDKGEKKYDFLAICSGPYNKPYKPEIKGIRNFKGTILHSSEFIDAEKICKGKKVVVVGSGKSAFDILRQAYNYGASCTIAMRDAHWLIPVDLKLFGLPFGYFNSSRFAGLFLDPFYTERSFTDHIFPIIAPVYWYFILSFVKKGIPDIIMPTREYKKEKLYRGGARDVGLFGMIGEGEVEAVRGHMTEIKEDRVIIGGKEIQADVIVFATGFEREYFGFPAEKDGLWLYRNTILPGVKNLAFVGIVNTYCNPLYTNIQAIWLAEMLRGRIRLPGEGKMMEDVAERKKYTRTVISGESTIPFSWFPYPMIDQFVKDMGLSTVRKSNRFKYWFEPLNPKDYTLLVTHRV